MQREIPLWRFVNENNLKTMVWNDHTFGWCRNDFHCKRPMCCGRPNFLNKSDSRAKRGTKKTIRRWKQVQMQAKRFSKLR
mmetsp:Transcript_28651/g.32938  ORF Transcript_28651/g.32938 Transcript_28651/m.32938 type:complete len:80 (-) Transcript_28651:1451-1690(-)